MFGRIYILIIVTIVGVLASTNSPKTAIRSYFIKKDFLNLFKLGDFSIYDPSEKHLLYRIKCSGVFKAKIELIDLSSNRVIGKLRNPLNLLLYNGNFSIFDSSADQWIHGRIERISHLLQEKYIIKWHGRSILMQTKFASLTTTFEHEYHSGILAEIKKRSFSFIRSNRYNLKIFSNDLPAEFYFIALAVKDQNNRGHSKG